MQNRFRAWNVELDSIENILNDRRTHSFTSWLWIFCLNRNYLNLVSVRLIRCANFFYQNFNAINIYYPLRVLLFNQNMSHKFTYPNTYVPYIWINLMFTFTFYMYAQSILCSRICTGDFLCMCHLCLRY